MAEINRKILFTVHEIRPEDIGLVSTKGDDEKQPFMVAFLKATNHVKVRARRDTKMKRTEYNPVEAMRSKFSGRIFIKLFCKL